MVNSGFMAIGTLRALNIQPSEQVRTQEVQTAGLLSKRGFTQFQPREPPRRYVVKGSDSASQPGGRVFLADGALA
jgi:hypothetical protein